MKNRLPEIGKALFDAVFSHRPTQRLFDKFQDASDKDRQLSIAGEHAEVLSLPWELLHDSAKGGVFLFRERPAVSIRRRLAGATGGRNTFKVETKDTLRLLFVVSRPDDAGFLDPRADPGAVMDALDAEAPGRVVCEFLRPATIDALTARLDNKSLPPIDIVHFDGHGVLDADGRLEDPNRKGAVGNSEAIRDQTRDASDGGKESEKSVSRGMGYLLFEDQDGKSHLVSAADVGQNLHRSQVSLVILSACQSAMVGDGSDPLAMVAARLTAAGIPAVLAMTHSVLVHTTRTLFGEFYRHLARGELIGASLDRARAFLQYHPQKYDVPPLTGDRKPSVLLSHSSLVHAFGESCRPEQATRSSGSSDAANSDSTSGLLRPRHEAGFFGRRRELWDIECWFAGPTERISITGFGGRGKTELALGAGRWLTRTGQFQRAVFVDYSRIQADAPESVVQVAVSHIGSVLDRSLTDVQDATAALRNTPTLVILDNLEVLSLKKSFCCV